jgi:hypothetical protein
VSVGSVALGHCYHEPISAENRVAHDLFIVQRAVLDSDRFMVVVLMPRLLVSLVLGEGLVTADSKGGDTPRQTH